VHGGGWTLGGIREADRPCRRLAVESGRAVLSIAYRQAPETPFPGAFSDCVAAVRWAAGHAAELGADADGLALVGDSAGGNLVAATALALREDGPAVAAQVLIYPCLAPPVEGEFDSYARYADGPLMTRAELEWFWGNYLPDAAAGRDPRAAPLRSDDLAGAPRALVVAAGLDPLRDEAIAYAGLLREAGVETELAVYRGAAHGFWWMDGEMRQAAELTAQVTRFLRSPRPA
jgi:acetyl esterase